MQTILGAGGAIANELAKALAVKGEPIRLVSRHPQTVTNNEQLVTADLTNLKEVYKAVKGSKVAYLTVGLPYNTRIWQKLWPVIMKNVINACEKEQVALVFFDNSYMYDPDYLSKITEETPARPISRKGEIRHFIAEQLLQEMRAGKINALIARSADFYGPAIKNKSLLTELVFKNLAKGEKPMWLVSGDYKHSFTYTPDAGKALALLGNSPDAYGQIWHLPTASPPLTGKEWIKLIAKEFDMLDNYRVLSRSMLRFLGVFIPVMREMVEMLYQYDRNYIFDGSKFIERFNFKPTSYLKAVREIINADYKKN